MTILTFVVVSIACALAAGGLIIIVVEVYGAMK